MMSSGTGGLMSLLQHGRSMPRRGRLPLRVTADVVKGLEDKALTDVLSLVVHEYRRLQLEPFKPPLAYIPAPGRYLGDENGLVASSTTTRYRCPVCESRGLEGATFVVESNLISHVADVHVSTKDVARRDAAYGKLDKIEARISGLEALLGTPRCVDIWNIHTPHASRLR